MKAAHQAAVEIGLMQTVGKKVTVISNLKTNAKLESVRIEGQSGNWGDRLRFPSVKVMNALLRHAAGDMNKAERIAFEENLKKMASGEDNRLYSADSKGQDQDSIGSLPLADGNLKFVVRVSPSAFS